MALQRNRDSSIVLNKGMPSCLSDRPYKTIRVFRITFTLGHVGGEDMK